MTFPLVSWMEQVGFVTDGPDISIVTFTVLPSADADIVSPLYLEQLLFILANTETRVTHITLEKNFLPAT